MKGIHQHNNHFPPDGTPPLGGWGASGFCAFGACRAERVDQAAIDIYNRWVAEGRCGDMAFAKRYMDLREDPRLLLEGCQWVVSFAFSYYTGRHHPFIADYALVRDYHIEIRERLGALALQLEAKYGCTTRVCVDSAPIRERYWAQRAGIGFIGKNNQLIIPGIGSRVVLGELLLAGCGDTPIGEILDSIDIKKNKVNKVNGLPSAAGGCATAPLPKASAATAASAAGGCDGCDACVAACPLGALDGKGGIDARRCISYLTIEALNQAHPDGTPPFRGSGGFGRIGCDICQRVCPYNQVEPPLSPFPVNESLLALTRESLATMSQGAWRRLTAESPLSRLRRKPSV